MTFTELTVAVALTVLFLCGLASASLPLAEADARSERLLREARETDFVIRGFRNACAREGGDFTGWTQAIALVDSLEGVSIRSAELPSGRTLWKLSCTVFGRPLTVYEEAP